MPFMKKYSLIPFVVLFLINLPFLISYSQSAVLTLAKFTCDELAFFQNINIILSQLTQGHILGAAYNCYSFGYGSAYWMISALLAFPAWIFNSEQGIIVTLRFASLLFSTASFFTIFLILREVSNDAYLSYLFTFLCFFNPLIVNYSNMIHPEMSYVFFLSLALYFLHRDANTFQKNFYLAIISFCMAISTKLIALLFAPAFLIYILYNYRKVTILLLGKSIFTGASTITLINIFLFFPLIFNRFFGWAQGASSVVKHGMDNAQQKSFVLNLLYVSENYFNIFLVFLLFIFAVLALIKHYKYFKRFIVFPTTTILLIIYFLFTVLYCHTPYHYGIYLIFLIPFLLFAANFFFIHLFAKTSPNLIVVVFLTVICLVNYKNLINACATLIHPAGVQSSRERSTTLHHIQNFIQNHPLKNLCIGVSTMLGVAPIKRKFIKFEWINEKTPSSQLKKYTLVILWKKDPYFSEIQKIMNNLQPFFRLISTDTLIEVYENRTMML